MNKRIFTILCVLAVVLVFGLTAQTVPLSWNAGAEDVPPSSSTTKKGSDEDIYVPPTTQSTTESTTQPTTESTTKPTTTEPTTKPTEKPPVSETEPTTKPTEHPPVSENESTTNNNPSEKESTKAPGGDTSTTTKKGGKPTTTKYTTTRPYVPHMTVPQIDNTTVEGTTLNPLDAYFERISGDSNTFTTAEPEETTVPEPEPPEEHKQLSTIAIVAICLGGIALVTVALTAGFAIRNKHAADDEDAAPDYETEAYGADAYEAPKDEPQTTRAQVDESDTFTVVSLDDKDYKD